MHDVMSTLANSGWLVQGVVALLCVFLLYIAYLIVERSRLYARTIRVVNDFDERFWSGASLAELYDELDQDKVISIPALFHMWMHEYHAQVEGNFSDLAEFERTMSDVLPAARERELHRLQRNLLPLSVFGSFASSLVGLFGAVWAVYATAQSSISSLQFTGLSDISGLKLATVISGAAAAGSIISKVSYERFMAKVDEHRYRMMFFSAEFTVIVARTLRRKMS